MQTNNALPIVAAVALFVQDRRAQGFSPKTIDFYRDRLGLFTRWCALQGITSLDGVAPNTLRGHFAWLIEQGRAPATQNASGRAIRTLLRWCIQEDLIAGNPLRNVRIPAPPKRILPAFTTIEIQKLLTVAPDARARAIVLFLLDSGVRVAELVALNAQDVDLTSGQVTVRAGKGDKTRTTYISPPTIKQLARYMRESGWIERAKPLWRNYHNDDRFTVSGVRQILRAMGKDAEVKGARPHQFRRTHAVMSLCAGTDLYTLAKQMGHSDIRVLRQYLDLLDTDVEAAHRKEDGIAQQCVSLCRRDRNCQRGSHLIVPSPRASSEPGKT